MESKLRIPRVATAVLVLGAACGDEKSDTASHLDPKGTDTSAERQDAIAEELCKLLLECEGASTDLLPVCTRNTKLDFQDYAEMVTDDCMDALLDYYGCYASLSCDELDADDQSEAAAECERAAGLETRCEDQFPLGD